MTSEHKGVETQLNRKTRTAVEKAMAWSIIISILASIILLHFDRTRGLFTDDFLDIAGFYPERLLLGSVPETVKVVLFVSNASTLCYLIIHLMVAKPETIQNDYDRQDRKNLLWTLCGFFYVLRFWLLYLFSSNSKSALLFLIPLLTIVSVSTALISLSTVGGSRRT